MTMQTPNSIFAEKSIELVIMDAIEKGFVKTTEDIKAYMQSEVFESACLRYMDLFEQEFGKHQAEFASEAGV